ncbi:MAG: hypothetical protein HOF87_06580 [Gemmatimonadales bacterium]|nr:hypothetical protein [Gemmatimonadales bacterium]
MKFFKYLTLAALVTVAACEEGEAPVIVAPPVTGTVSGVVTLEGSAASGVSVGLSSGVSATTDGSGAYSFTGVTAGSYTVTISGFASDASFAATVMAVTVSSAGQVATANFSGSYIRTSAILGSVTGGGLGLAGVTVSLTGGASLNGQASLNAAASTTTGAGGDYSFSGLRAGTYTVAVSGFDAGMYSFAATSESVTLGVGSSEVVTFGGSLLTTAMITGRMFLDENDKDNSFSAGLEDNLSVAGVTVTIEGVLVDNTSTVVTAADGTFSVSDLAAGTYRVTLTMGAPIPGMVTFGGTNPQLITLTTGSTGTVDFPFDITTQTIKVGGFLGTDNDVSTTPGPKQSPVVGWTISLYDTQANAVAATATGRLGAVATGTDGYSAFRFARTADVSPNSAENDQVIFASVTGPPSVTHTLSGERILEIKYSAKDSMSMANDEFDALYNSITFTVHAAESDADTLASWGVIMRSRVDSTISGAIVGSGATTDANGDATFTVTPATIIASGDGGDGVFPDTLWFRLRDTQAGANGHAFTQAPTASGGTAAGSFLSYIWNGTDPAGTTIALGTQHVTYSDTDISVGIHHERDDSSAMPTFTALDDRGNVDGTTLMELFSTAATPASVSGPTAPAAGVLTMANIATGSYTLHARATDGTNVVVLSDTTVSITLDGSDQVYTDQTLTGGAGNSTFAIKTANNTVSGVAMAADGATAAAGVIVTLAPTAMNIQGTASYMDTTSATGAYAFTGVREGPYTVMVADIAGTWEFFDTLTTATAPTISGNLNNTDAKTASRDVQGYGTVTTVANYQAVRMDTKVQGVVVNDRDEDYNTLDPDEALSGVMVELIDDADADGVIDATESVLSSTTTDIVGAYGFSGLREDDYIVRVTSPSNATVLRGLSATGSVTSTARVTTAAAVGVGATLNQSGTRQVGNMSPPAQLDEFPRWDYMTGSAELDGGNVGAGPNSVNGAPTTGNAVTGTHFVHLFKTGTVKGQITAAGVGVTTGVRVTLTRCQTAPAEPSPPAAGACTLKHGVPSPHIQNFDTDASGNYTFSGLLEGVYQLDVAPATGGYTVNEGLDGVAGGADVNVLATIVGNNDVETIAAYEIS